MAPIFIYKKNKNKKNQLKKTIILFDIYIYKKKNTVTAIQIKE